MRRVPLFHRGKGDGSPPMVQLGPALLPSVVMRSSSFLFGALRMDLVLVVLAVDFNLSGTVEAPGGEEGKPLELFRVAGSQVTAPGPAGVGSRTGRDEDAGLYGVLLGTAIEL